MNKIYALVPLVGLLLFGGYYWKHSRLHAARLDAIQRIEETARQERRAKEAADRAHAHDQAALTLALRKQERAEKDRLESAQKQARLALEQRRDAAAERAHRLRPQRDRLHSEIVTIAAALARAEERKRELQDEKAFLAEYVRTAEANQNAIQRLLETAETIERNHAAAPPPGGAVAPRKS